MSSVCRKEKELNGRLYLIKSFTEDVWENNLSKLKKFDGKKGRRRGKEGWERERSEMAGGRVWNCCDVRKLQELNLELERNKEGWQQGELVGGGREKNGNREVWRRGVSSSCFYPDSRDICESLMKMRREVFSTNQSLAKRQKRDG